MDDQINIPPERRSDSMGSPYFAEVTDVSKTTSQEASIGVESL